MITLHKQVWEIIFKDYSVYTVNGVRTNPFLAKKFNVYLSFCKEDYDAHKLFMPNSIQRFLDGFAVNSISYEKQKINQLQEDTLRPNDPFLIIQCPLLTAVGQLIDYLPIVDQQAWNVFAVSKKMTYENTSWFPNINV